MTPHPDADPGDRLLEQLCFYRRLYEHRGDADRSIVLSVSAAVDYAELLLRVHRTRAERHARRNVKPLS